MIASLAVGIKKEKKELQAIKEKQNGKGLHKIVIATSDELQNRLRVQKCDDQAANFLSGRFFRIKICGTCSFKDTLC